MYEVESSNDRRQDASLQHYLQTIGKYRLLTREEEFALARRIRDGDKAALDQLVNANLRFVVSVAKKFLNHGLSYMDLIAEGNIGLITAARRFDERREFRFISYAVWWIRQSIQKAIAEQTNTVRLPINRAQQAQRMKRIARDLEQKHGRPVGEEEIAAALSISPQKMSQIRAATGPLASIDETIYDDDLSLGDTLVDPSPNPEQEHLATELETGIAAAMHALSARERTIVAKYYGLGEEDTASLEAIGREMALSRERVRQLRNLALAKIRLAVARDQLLVYYG